MKVIHWKIWFANLNIPVLLAKLSSDVKFAIVMTRNNIWTCNISLPQCLHLNSAINRVLPSLTLLPWSSKLMNISAPSCHMPKNSPTTTKASRSLISSHSLPEIMLTQRVWPGIGANILETNPHLLTADLNYIEQCLVQEECLCQERLHLLVKNRLSPCQHSHTINKMPPV